MGIISKIFKSLKIEFTTSVKSLDSELPNDNLNDIKTINSRPDDYHLRLSDDYYRRQTSSNSFDHHSSSHHFNPSSSNSYNR